MPIIVSRGAASIKALGFAGAGKPLAPTIGTATRSSAAINVVFTPGYNGGAPITTYTATSTPGNYIFTGSSSPIVATGMTLGTSYTFTVHATNVYGDSPESQSSNSLKYASVPPAPTIGPATVTGITSVSVSFTAPLSDGGEPITQYTAFALVGGIIHGEFGRIFQSGSGSITVNGLTSGVGYTFKVVAANTLGNGVYSSASNGVTPDLPTYNITSNLLAMIGTEFVDEGATASFYIDTNETVTATTLYWSVSGTGITVGDFTSGVTTGSISISPAVRSTLNLAIKADGSTEGSETFTLNFYTNSSRTTLLTDTAISGYVIGNARTVSINDTSTISYSISPNVSSVNEGSSVTFTVTRTDSGTGTAYWDMQALSGTVNSSDLTTSGSVSVSSGSGTFNISITADQVTEGAESFRVLLYSDSGRTILVAASSTVIINDTSLYPAAGTYLSNYCDYNTYTLYYTYADGSGGSYSSPVQYNSPTCGYVAPTVPGITLTFLDGYYLSYPPYTNTKASTVIINNGSSLSGASYSVTASGLTRNTDLLQPTSGTLLVGPGTYIAYIGPHDASTAYVTVSLSGYTSYTGSLSIPANANYSPYTYALGFSQEYSRTGSALTLAQGIGTEIYASNRFYLVDYGDGQGSRGRYAFYRAPDAGGLNYWTGYCISNGYNYNTQTFINIIIQSGEIAGERVLTDAKSYIPGTGYNTFNDKP